ncbi:MAG TPA: hypothetical protein VL860_15315, partial [Planctomycetota bacterium]|nr:hypothetical protein [Planctomycetota bacterium]
MTTPPIPPAPAADSTQPPATTPAAPAPYVMPPIDDEFVRTREHELSRREHLLVTALLPCALLLFGTNSVLVWLLPKEEYGFWSIESLVSYGLATFLLAVYSYVKWRYVWSVRRAHHLSFYLKRVIEVVAALSLVVMGSYLFGFQYYYTADLTSDRRLSLSPRSVEILKELPDGGRVEIFMPFSESGAYHMSEADRLALVRERRTIGRVCKDIEEDAPKYTKAIVKFTAINVNEEPNKATELAVKLGAPPGPSGTPVLPSGASENLFILYTPPPLPGAGPQPAPAWNFIAKNRMYQEALHTKRGQSGGVAFVGESRILSTIEGLRLSKRTVAYYIDNHSRGTSPVPDKSNAAVTILNSNNLTGLPLNLLTAEAIPADARFVLLWNIQSPLSDAECDKLYKYVIGG